MLAVNRIDFQNIAIETPEALAALRASGKLPFDQMPLLELDGLNLSQSSAMVRYLARRGDLYGDDDTDALWCDMIAGAVADFVETAIQAAFQSSTEIAMANMRASFAKFGPCFEARLASNGGDFCVGTRLSFADVVLTEALTSYLEWLPGILSATPRLKGLQSRVVEHDGIASYLGSEQRYPKAGDGYVIAAAQVLQRALPPHMPDAARFVVKA